MGTNDRPPLFQSRTKSRSSRVRPERRLLEFGIRYGGNGRSGLEEGAVLPQVPQVPSGCVLWDYGVKGGGREPRRKRLLQSRPVLTDQSGGLEVREEVTLSIS